MPLVEVVPGRVWQGGVLDAAVLTVGSEAWTRLGIRAVLRPAFNAQLAYHEDLATLTLPVDDHDTVAPETFELAVAFHRLCGPTLVHCFGGRNRSVAFAAALAIAEGKTLEEALNAMGQEPTRELLGALRGWLLRRRQP